MAEFLLNAKETLMLHEAIENGLNKDRRKGVGKIKSITRLLKQISLVQKDDLISLELPDKDMW